MLISLCSFCCTNYLVYSKQLLQACKYARAQARARTYTHSYTHTYVHPTNFALGRSCISRTIICLYDANYSMSTSNVAACLCVTNGIVCTIASYLCIIRPTSKLMQYLNFSDILGMSACFNMVSLIACCFTDYVHRFCK